jgi:electron transfer flavoprotein alpha subunit
VNVTGLEPSPGTDAILAAGVKAVRAIEAVGVVVPRGPDALELVPRLAARLGGGAVAGVSALRPADGGAEAVAAVFGGAARATYRILAGTLPVVGLAAGAGEPPTREQGRATATLEIAADPSVRRRVRVTKPATATGGPRLEDARVVVSGGRGLRTVENYALIRELASLLGGMPGASRAIVDDGWATAQEQVGLTGTIVTPEFYFAAGISGASQHLAGCSNARTIVAINTDPDAPIFRYANYGIVGDALEVLAALIAEVRRRREIA